MTESAATPARRRSEGPLDRSPDGIGRRAEGPDLVTVDASGGAARAGWLVAVQSAMRPRDYATADAFEARVAADADAALGGLPGVPGEPVLLAFPEAIALPLPWTLADRRLAAAAERDDLASRSLVAAALRRAPGALAAWFASPGSLHGAWWHPGAVVADRAVRRAFAAVARRHRATVSAGSWFTPEIDAEPSRGVYLRRGRVLNVSLLFGPGGEVLARAAKVVPTRLERLVGVRGGAPAELEPVATALGRVGTAICLDAFHRSVIERLDAAGAEIVLQPSANHAPWDRRWPPDPRLTEGEAWLRYGVRAQLPGRRSLLWGVNAMAVGDVGPLHPRGRSTIVVDPERVAPSEAWGRKGRDDPSPASSSASSPASSPASSFARGVVAIAPGADRPAALRVRIPLPLGTTTARRADR